MQAFQTQKFSRNSGATSAILNLNSFKVHGIPDDTYDEDDDGLGYYPDGVKRTLTDEQIAMFRHSEIYALQRAHQVRQENQEAELETQLQNTATELGLAPQITTTCSKQGEDEILDDSDDEEEYARFLEAEKRKAEASQTRKKRKTNGVATHRRVARELDISVAVEQVLDYGEETSQPGDVSKKTTLTDSLPDVGGLSQHPQVLSNTAQRNLDKVLEGRKIWWPTITK